MLENACASHSTQVIGGIACAGEQGHKETGTMESDDKLASRASISISIRAATLHGKRAEDAMHDVMTTSTEAHAGHRLISQFRRALLPLLSAQTAVNLAPGDAAGEMVPSAQKPLGKPVHERLLCPAGGLGCPRI